ncbi:MAG: GNAT family N-acetyltransferase [Anaerolineae bacterium]|nr:GNAT family N-acetyltransferase [Anaerolineae bacterium]
MTLTMRICQQETDYWRIRAFLHEQLIRCRGRWMNWEAIRLDLWRRHCLDPNDWPASMDEVTFIWETTEGQIAAVLNPEGPGEAFLQVHPDHRTPELEKEMIAVAEQQLASPVPDGQKKLSVWANEHDTLRQTILARRGYTKGDWPEHRWRRSLDLPIPDAPLPPGYTVRALGDATELPARVWASWKTFHPHDPDDQYEGGEWYQDIQRLPLYRRDLDLVAVAPGGEIVSFCTTWFDDVTRDGFFEPVGTMPAHQRRGLARAAICEGMHRLKQMGATMAHVGGFSVAANALYASIMSPEPELVERWEKLL